MMMNHSTYLRQRALTCLELVAERGAEEEADDLIAMAPDYDLWARHFDVFQPKRRAYPGNSSRGGRV